MNHIKKHTPTKKKPTPTANLKKHRRTPHQQHGATFSTTTTTTTRNIRTASRNKRCVQDAVDMVNDYTHWKRNKHSMRDAFVLEPKEMTVDHAFTPPGKATATHLHPNHHHDINRHAGRGATTIVDTMKNLTHHLYPHPERIVPTRNTPHNSPHHHLHTAFHPTRAVWAPQKRNTTASGASGSSMYNFDESFINMNNEEHIKTNNNKNNTNTHTDQTLSFKQHEPLSENGLENYQAASTFNANIYASEKKPSFHSRELTNNGGNNNNTTNMTNSNANNNINNNNNNNNQRQQRQSKQSTTTSTSSRTSRRTKNNEINNTNKDTTTTTNTAKQAVGGNDSMGQNADHFAI